MGILRSKAPPAEKALACKRLAVYGSEKAVPALAPLLADKELASWARIPLEAIPGPAADKALRNAAGKLQGQLLVGVLNSIGVRRDPKAVSRLASLLKAPDPEVASAAADALGRIGGVKATTMLTRFLPQSPDAVRSAAAEGCIRCAEKCLAENSLAEAMRVYDLVRQTQVPKQRLLEATRGAILARQADGLPLLLEQLHSADKALFGIGISTARELPGRTITEALAAQMPGMSPERQPFLLLALAERHDPAALPAIVASARQGSKPLRLAAVGILDRAGDAAHLQVLLDCAADTDTDVAQAAKAAVARLAGGQVDADLLARLARATGQPRLVLIELTGRRNLTAAIPSLLPLAKDSDAATRIAALQAIGVLGAGEQVPEIVALLQQAATPEARGAIEATLLALSGRAGSSCVPNLEPLAKAADSNLRMSGLHALAAAGGPQALSMLQIALQDKDETVQDEAVRTLSTWPNTWPEDAAVTEPLLEVAKSDSKTAHQVLALRGYLQFLQGDKQLKNEDKVAKVKAVLPLLQRPEEKRLAIGVLGEVPAPDALELLLGFAAEPEVAEDACTALANATAKEKPAFSKEQRRKALETVVEKSQQAPTRKKAQDALKKLKT